MDRKSILILLVCFVLLMLWYPLVNRLFPPKPAPETTLVTEPAATNLPAAPAPHSLPTEPSAVITASQTGVLPSPDLPEQTVTVENDVARYVFTSHGGGLKAVELKRYQESVGRQARGHSSTNGVAALNEAARAPVLALLGDPSLQGDATYELIQDGLQVIARKELTNGLRIEKRFRVSTNYLVHATVRLENRSSESLLVPGHEVVFGTATPISARDDGTLMSVQWFDGNGDSKVQAGWFANKTLGCFPGTPRALYEAETTNILWAAAQNRFFTLIAILPTNAPAPHLVVRQINLPPPSAQDVEQDRQVVKAPIGFQGTLVYPPSTLAAGQSLDREIDLFGGPKEYRTLDRLAGRFGNEVDRVMNFSGFFGFFAKILLLSMNGFHAAGLPYGLAIVAITVIIKLLFWPLTQMSTRSMKRMQELQPKMKEIQEKYKEDPRKMNQKTMEFMRENRINPAAGCLPMLVQIPVFFGFYTMLQSAIELRGARFLWAFDLSQPDTIFVIPGVGFPVNLLPLIMGATQLWQMKLTPPSPGVDPVQQKMLQYMPLIFLFILYNFSSGLTLYWTVQNLLTIAQMKLTRSSGVKGAPATPAASARPATRGPSAQKPKKR